MKPKKHKPPKTEATEPHLMLHPVADNLLLPLWRAVPSDYKMRYARNIWEQFEERIRSSTYTSGPSAFLNQFCQSLGATLLAEDVERVAAFIGSQDPRVIMRSLREETTLLVIHVRLANDKRKEEWAKKESEKSK